MSPHQIVKLLEITPNTMCWLHFGTGQVALMKGEGLVLLRCMIRNLDEPHENYTGPTRVRYDRGHVEFMK